MFCGQRGWQIRMKLVATILKKLKRNLELDGFGLVVDEGRLQRELERDS